ncbi:MAG: FGGY-family carbohydrate kinase [Rhizomicrobium sp.]
MSNCLALDFGASSIRLIDVSLIDGRLALKELARFVNGPHMSEGRLVWDYGRIFENLKAALKVAGASGVPYAGIGADSWGVDFVVIGKTGALTCPPVAYRDARTDGAMERYFARHRSAQELFAVTGIQCLPFNTLFQLFAQSRSEPDVLQQAHRLLLTADYAHFWLCGVAANERTLASTSQMLTLAGHWWPEALETVALAPGALTDPVAPGTVLGPLRVGFAAETGLRDLKVIAPAAHDTQSAIAAIPAASERDWAYLSSGTWSIIGVESEIPFNDAAAEAAGLSNETGYAGTYCVQSTVTGLWLVQEIQRLLDDRSDGSALAAEAEQVPAFRFLIDPADSRFFNPSDMIDEIRSACRAAGEPEPVTPAELVRCAYDSLALLYRAALLKLSAVTGRRFARLHVVGGGSKAVLLNRLCAATTGLPVLAGPAEATALGNAMIQFIALGQLSSVTQGRKTIRESFPPVLFEPKPLPGLQEAITRFDRLTSS